MLRRTASRVLLVVAVAIPAGVLALAGRGGGGPAASAPASPVNVGRTVFDAARAPSHWPWLHSALSAAAERPSATPPRATQIKVLDAAVAKMTKEYSTFSDWEPGPVDVLDYGVGSLWAKGIDGAGETVAVVEGWSDPKVTEVVDAFDKPLGLPNPTIKTLYVTGHGHPGETCPKGMVALGQYGSCRAWAGEFELDVLAAHLMAPYATILTVIAPPDSEITDDAASQVAPPEMMEALEQIAKDHLANVISISDGSDEAGYAHGAEEITAQDPGELAAAAAGIPVLVATGDSGVVQTTPSFDGDKTTATPDTGTWDDSPWVTAVGGSLPDLSATGSRLGPDPLWPYESAGYSAVFSRPGYQNQVARVLDSRQRSVPDLVMDSSDGTSEAAPLLAGILALATEDAHRDLGPINDALYERLGHAGARDGIVDVVSGDDAVTNSKGVVEVPGFAAAPGFDVASGWGTIDAPRFVPSLVAASAALGFESRARGEAATALSRLEENCSLTTHVVSPDGTSYLLAGGYLPGHPVDLEIDGRTVAVLRASDAGYVTDMIEPALLGLPAGTHTIELRSMLLDSSTSLTVR